jgi:hypothetical protein
VNVCVCFVLSYAAVRGFYYIFVSVSSFSVNFILYSCQPLHGCASIVIFVINFKLCYWYLEHITYVTWRIPVISAYSENHVKITNTLCRQNSELLIVKAGSTYINHWALSLYIYHLHYQAVILHTVFAGFVCFFRINRDYFLKSVNKLIVIMVKCGVLFEVQA